MSTVASGRAGGEAGVTMAEVGVSLFVLGLIALLAFSAFRSYRGGIDLKRTAYGLAGDARSAQQLSISRDENYRLVITTGPSPLYRIERVAGATVVKEVDLSTEVVVTTTFASDTVEFQPTGAPLAAGRVVIAVTGGTALTVCVRPATGHVEVLEGTVTSCP